MGTAEFKKMHFRFLAIMVRGGSTICQRGRQTDRGELGARACDGSLGHPADSRTQNPWWVVTKTPEAPEAESPLVI